MVADSFTTLLKYPSELVATEIHAWITTQYRGRGSEIPVSDYLFHAMKKIHEVGEFNLVSRDKLKQYFLELKERVIDLCPPEDRDFLRQNIEMLGDSFTAMSATVEVVHRQGGSESHLASDMRASRLGLRADSAPAAATVRRLGMLLDRLQPLAAASGIGQTAAGPPMTGHTPAEQDRAAHEQEQIISHALAAVAGAARDGGELRQYLENARELGVDPESGKLFQLLSRSLPTWAVPAGSLPSPEEWPDSATPDPIDAMRRIVSLAEDPDEGARRYKQMVIAAIEQFNEGSLGRAATMIELAQRLEAEKTVDDTTAKSTRGSSHTSIDQTRLKAYAESKEAHFLLRKILSFFTSLTPAGLIEELKFEQKRERRRAILAVLEVYGQEARAAAIKELKEINPEKPQEETNYILRNLLYVLNRVPQTDPDATDKEIDLIAAFTAPKFPPFVLKESIAALALTRHERAERILIRRLTEVEAILMRPAAPGKRPPNDVRQLLDRITLALSRFSSATALRAIVDHALKSYEQLGDTRGRLAPLASHDLTPYPDVIARLAEAIRSELPKKVLGLVRAKAPAQITKLVEALSATPAPEVYELFEEIRSRFPDQELAKTATAALANFGSGKPAEDAAIAPSLTGDLEVFGLPNLLQSLFESELTGILTIFDHEGRSVGAISFERGKIARCQIGALRGKDALFQLFEDAKPGTFAFVRKQDIPKDEGPLLDVQPLVFEALRRFDELREARLLVPEDIALNATGMKPPPHPRETDAKLVREVWVRAAAGEKPSSLSSHVGADAYRIWRLLAFWVEGGVLQPKT